MCNITLADIQYENVKDYLRKKIFKQSFSDRINQLINESQDDWDRRARGSAQRILTATCFRETAIASAESKDSLIYQPIGLYYSMFHLSLAMLWLNPRVDTKDLKEIHHSRLISFVKSQLVQAKFIDKSFLDLLCDLKELREFCNYQFGYADNLDIKIDDAINRTETEFENAFKFIHQVLDASDSLFRVQTGIGDFYGDDILDTYLSSEHKGNVFQYLAFRGLST
jgi:uncharacterized protein (UPF0332 family)